MKKYTAIILIFFFASVLVSCKAETPSETTINSVSELSAARINKNKIEFGDSEKTFFYGDVDLVLDKIEPLILSAAESQAHFRQRFTSHGTVTDKNSAWLIVYTLINSYGTDDEDIKSTSDGNLTATLSVMKKYFYYTIDGFEDKIPVVTNELKDRVQFDKAKNVYIIQKTMSEDWSFVLRGITINHNKYTLDQAESAVISLNVSNGFGEIVGSADVEIVHFDNSKYGYIIKTAEFDPK